VLRVGLTGGIACGKSVVLRELGACGLATVDLDVVAHEVMAPRGRAYPGVVDAFGPRVLAADGTIDRIALGAIVFADEAARLTLNRIVHPVVRAEEAKRTRALAEAGHEIVVTDAALLVESGAHLRFDRLVVVHCAPQTQRQRLCDRDGLSDEEARARIVAQMPVEEKRRFAHFEVDTGGSLTATAQAVRRLAAVLRGLPGASRPSPEVSWTRAAGALAWSDEPGPRGLSSRALLEETLDAGGVELARLRERLDPPGSGPWYRAARPGEAAPWPEGLAPALALWGLVRGRDEDWLDAAAASLCRLTHGHPPSIAAACLAARAARDLLEGGDLHELPGRLGAWDDAAWRWGGATPAPRVRRAVEAAARHAADPPAAAAEARAAGAEGALAAALAAAGSTEQRVEPVVAERLLDRLRASARESGS
jgi:dephospho-CoA kinase